jgi:ribonuclease HII
MIFPSFRHELQCFAKGYTLVVGCDEVGVGPLAGPVVAAACVIDPETVRGYRTKSKWFYRVRDSKTTHEAERQDLAKEIKSHCLAYGIGSVPSETIDKINIHNASLVAMKQAVANLIKSLSKTLQFHEHKTFLFLDGRFTIKEIGYKNITQKAVVAGDSLVLSIAAASIIAKVYRDDLLKELDHKFPVYGFSRNKGYNTEEHRQAILKNGITEFHRKSFLKNFDLSQSFASPQAQA